MKAWRALPIVFFLFLAVACNSEAPQASLSQPLSAANNSCGLPADILDLTNWKVTLPIEGEPGKPKEITQPQLDNYEEAPYFIANDTCDGVVFRAGVNGFTTDTADYPRSELREMTNGGADEAAWDFNSGTHTMFIDQKITKYPDGKKHIVAGQIHDASDDVLMIRLENKKLFVEVEMDGVSDDTYILDSDYALGERFTIEMVVENGEVVITYTNNGNVTTYPISSNSTGNYFKAGAYTQSNCETEDLSFPCPDSNNYGEVVIYQLAITHDVSSNPPPTVTGVFEAEAGTVIAPMEVFSDSTANGGAYVTQPGSTDEGRIEYTVSVPQTGDYILRSRVIAAAGDRNSIFYAFDGAAQTALAYPNNLTSWTWHDGPQVTLSTGTHTFTVWNRERDTRLDAFELAPVGGLPPATGVFQAESGMVTAPMQVFSDAAAQSGEYVTQSNSAGQGRVDYTISVPNAGDYVLRSRVIAAAGDRNSIFYAFDGGSQTSLVYPDNLTSWTWHDGPTVTLSAGTHSFTVWNRERDTRLDAFEIEPVISSTVIFEAESGTVSSPMEVRADSAAQGGEYVVQPDSSGQGSVTYTLSVPSAGIYTLRSRVIASAGDRNSIFYAFDGGGQTSLSYPDDITDWTWVDGPQVSLSAGSHSFTVWNRERDTRLDSFELVTTN